MGIVHNAILIYLMIFHGSLKHIKTAEVCLSYNVSNVHELTILIELAPVCYLYVILCHQGFFSLPSPPILKRVKGPLEFGKFAS